MKLITSLLKATVFFVVAMFAYSLYDMVRTGERLLAGQGLAEDSSGLMHRLLARGTTAAESPNGMATLAGFCGIALLDMWLRPILQEFQEVMHKNEEAIRRHVEALGTLGDVEIRPGACELASYEVLFGGKRIVGAKYLVMKACDKRRVQTWVRRDLMSRTNKFFRFRCEIYKRFNRIPLLNLVSTVEDFALDGCETDLCVTEDGVRRGFIVRGLDTPTPP